MDIYVYSDESGVFDYIHNDYFVYGGLIFLSKPERDIFSRKYISAEKNISHAYSAKIELKASQIRNKDKNKLYKLAAQEICFGVVIDQHKVNKNVFSDKLTKQRFLDYAYKRALKEAFKKLQKKDIINFDEVFNIYISVDEHTTATNGRYNLEDGLRNEFLKGTFNWNYNLYFPPIFKNLKNLQIQYCDSNTTTIVRAADIVANRMYYKTTHALELDENIKDFTIFLPD